MARRNTSQPNSTAVITRNAFHALKFTVDTNGGEFRASRTIRDTRLSRYRKKPAHRARHFYLLKHFCEIRAHRAPRAGSSMKEATRVLATVFGITGIPRNNGDARDPRPTFFQRDERRINRFARPAHFLTKILAHLLSVRAFVTTTATSP